MSSSMRNPYSFQMPSQNTVITAVFKQTTTIQPLVVNFGMVPKTDAPQTEQFTSQVYGGVPPYTYFWSFGDGSYSEEANPVHTYEQPGVYNVTLTVMDSVGDKASETLSIQVYPNPTPAPSGCSFPVTTRSPASCILAAFKASGYYYLLSPSDQQAAAADPAG